MSVDAVDRRSPSEIGRHARLELRFVHRGGRTVLAHAYAEPPLRVGRCFAEDAGVHLILASSAPGVFPGDVFEQSVIVEPGANVRLTSQSSQQVHPGTHPEAARIESRYHVHDGATLACEWHPTIPFPDARLAQQIAVDIEGDGRLRWSDAMMSGRESRGERWRFERLHHELQVRHGGRLRYLERYAIEPASERPDRRWAAHRANYFGTMLALGWRHDRARVGALQSSLDQSADADAVIDRLDEDLVLVRLMADSGAPFHAARARIAASW